MVYSTTGTFLEKPHTFYEKCKQSITFSLPDQSVEATGDYPKKNTKEAKLV